ncbi:hypothetical protein AAFC00_000281 [Neodothiora populina]|uniref:NADH-ubiquinone oxidoreductase 29.9 kDa subunit n=1 Tax=Neodothiora populina TaxID=2781224 RepID=A0ABR3PCE5_9PEZI
MRASLRLLASAKYLTPGAPTGLTGVFTHAAPRTTLLYLYNSTLDKLKQFPEHSVYRQSVEALTKHRLSIVESVKPEGLESWQERVRHVVESNPQAFKQIGSITDPKQLNFVFKESIIEGMRTEEFDDEPLQKAEPEGPRSQKDRSHQGEAFARDLKVENEQIPRIEPEPRLTADQVESIEQQVGAGLIEEIINVADAEHSLVDVMYKSEVWDDLAETPVEGQWNYHDVQADSHVPATQAP